MEVTPEIRKAGKAWEGQIRVDGQRITIDENTALTIKPNNAQKKATKDAEKAAKKRKEQGSNADSEESEAPSIVLSQPDQIHANAFVTYEGLRQRDGTVLAKKIEFQESEVTSGESRLWKTLTPKIKEPSFTDGRPGELKIQQVGIQALAQCRSSEICTGSRHVAHPEIPAATTCQRPAEDSVPVFRSGREGAECLRLGERHGRGPFWIADGA